MAQVGAGVLAADPSAQGRLVPERNLHATLVFLGQVGMDRFADVIAAAQAVKAAPFEFRLDRLALWRDAGVLVLEVERTPAAFDALVASLRDALGRFGFAVEARRPRLHVTLARKVRVAPATLLTPPIVCTANDFALVQSDTLPDGSEYTVLRRWPLG